MRSCRYLFVVSAVFLAALLSGCATSRVAIHQVPGTSPQSWDKVALLLVCPPIYVSQLDGRPANLGSAPFHIIELRPGAHTIQAKYFGSLGDTYWAKYNSDAWRSELLDLPVTVKSGHVYTLGYDIFKQRRAWGPPGQPVEKESLLSQAVLAAIFLIDNGPRKLTSPDGQREISFEKASRGNEEHLVEYVVREKGGIRRYPVTDSIQMPVYSPDQKRMIFRTGIVKERYRYVLDGKEGIEMTVAAVFDPGRTMSMREHSNFDPFKPIFTPDSNTAIYAAHTGHTSWSLVRNHTPDDSAYSVIDLDCIAVSPDGSRVAYVAKKGSKWHVVVDGKVQKGYDTIDRPVFSPDSRRLAYAVEHGISKAFKATMVIDGNEGKAYDRVFQPVFSGDSELCGYVVSDYPAGHRAVVEGKEYEACEDIIVNSLRFIDKPGPRAKQVSYRARASGAWRDVVNEVSSAK